MNFSGINDLRHFSAAPSVSVSGDAGAGGGPSGGRSGLPKLSDILRPADTDTGFFQPSSPHVALSTSSSGMFGSSTVVSCNSSSSKPSSSSQLGVEPSSVKTKPTSAASLLAPAAVAAKSTAMIGQWRVDGLTPQELVPPQAALSLRERVATSQAGPRCLIDAVPAVGDDDKKRRRFELPLQRAELACSEPWSNDFETMPRCHISSVLECRITNSSSFVVPHVQVQLMDEDEIDDITSALVKRIYFWSSKRESSSSHQQQQQQHQHQQPVRVQPVAIAGFRICFDTALDAECFDGLRFKMRVTLEDDADSLQKPPERKKSTRRRCVLTSSKIMMRFKIEGDEATSSNSRPTNTNPGAATTLAANVLTTRSETWSKNCATYLYWSRGLLRPQDRICDAVFIDPGRSNSLLSVAMLDKATVLAKVAAKNNQRDDSDHEKEDDEDEEEDDATIYNIMTSSAPSVQPLLPRDRIVSNLAQQQQQSTTASSSASGSSQDVIFLGQTAAAAAAAIVKAKTAAVTRNKKGENDADSAVSDFVYYERAGSPRCVVAETHAIALQQQGLLRLCTAGHDNNDHDGQQARGAFVGSGIIDAAASLPESGGTRTIQQQQQQPEQRVLSKKELNKMKKKKKKKQKPIEVTLDFSPRDGAYAGVDCEREIILVDAASDSTLQQWIRETADVRRCLDSLFQAKALCTYVALVMGGFPVNEKTAEAHTMTVRRHALQAAVQQFQIDNATDRSAMALQRPHRRLAANVVPLGLLQNNGLCRHRALLLKFLADAHRVPMFLVRGDYRSGGGGGACAGGAGVSETFPHVWCVCPLVSGPILLDPTLSPSVVLPWPDSRYVPQFTTGSADYVADASSVINLDSILNDDDDKSSSNSSSGTSARRPAAVVVDECTPVLKEECGRGASAIVYRMELGPFSVAAKTPINPETDLPVLRREFAILQRLHALKCPCIPRVIGWHRGILMEYFPTSLLGFMNMLVTQEESLSVAQRRTVARGILSALAFLHDVNDNKRPDAKAEAIIHRDIKAENVMLIVNRCVECQRTSLQCSECEIVPHLVDFADAVSIAGWPKQRHVMLPRVGTPPYTAPEVMAEQPFSTPADMWSFGMLLVEMRIMSLPVADSGCVGSNIALSKFGETKIFVPDTEDEQDPVLGEIAAGCLKRAPEERITATEALAKLRRKNRDNNN